MKIEKFLNKDLEVNILIRKFESLNESKKSQFVAKLIGLGVLVRDSKGKGKFKPGPNKMSKDEVLGKLKKKKKGKK